MDTGGYATQDEQDEQDEYDCTPPYGWQFLPITATEDVVPVPTTAVTSSDEDDHEVQVATSGALLNSYFYWEKDDRVYALADSERLKYEGNGAIPGFVCNFDGDFYRGNKLSWGRLEEVQEWVPRFDARNGSGL